MQAIPLIIAIVEALPRIAASGTAAWNGFMQALRATGDAELNAKLDAMKAEDLRRALISEAEASS